MTVIAAFVKRHPLACFFGLAFAMLLAVTPLASIAPELPPFVLVFLPALAALIVTGISAGRAGVTSLLKRLTIWRVHPVWYAVVLGLPVAVGTVMVGLAVLLGSPTATQIGSVSFFSFLFFVFAVGEELGWRGFALPTLLADHSPVTASLLLGLLWAAFHLPLFLPGQFFARDPLIATALVFVATSFVYTWVFQHTRGSVLMATLLHGAINASSIFTAGMDPVAARWLQAVTWGLVAVLVVVLDKSMRGAATHTPDEPRVVTEKA